MDRIKTVELIEGKHNGYVLISRGHKVWLSENDLRDLHFDIECLIDGYHPKQKEEYYGKSDNSGLHERAENERSGEGVYEVQRQV